MNKQKFITKQFTSKIGAEQNKSNQNGGKKKLSINSRHDGKGKKYNKFEKKKSFEKCVRARKRIAKL